MADEPGPLGEDLMRAFGGVHKGLRQWVRSLMGTGQAMTVGRAGVLLGLLERDEPVSMSALGTAHDVTPRAMTVLVSGLEREGLVQRTAHPQDKRVTLLTLTSGGRAIAAQQLAPARAEAAALFGGLSQRDQAELLRLLGEVAKLLAQRGIEVPAP